MWPRRQSPRETGPSSHQQLLLLLPAMIVTYKHDPVFIHSFNYALGGLRRNLEELKEQNLLLGDVATLREAGAIGRTP